MRESIGSTFLYNMIFAFIIIVMGLLTATLNYYKSYKVNNYILNIISDNSGYNTVSAKKIDTVLKNFGYSVPDSKSCPKRNGVILIDPLPVDGVKNYSYCVYYYQDETSTKSKQSEETVGSTDNSKLPSYYAYGVTTFIAIDLPIVGRFRVPVFTKGNRIYRFTGSCQPGVDCSDGVSN